MEESRLVARDAARQESGSLVGISEPPGVASVERQLEARLSRILDGGSEHTDLAERLLFWIDDKPYSAALTSLWEALPAIPKTAPLPFSPSWLVGLFPLRTDLVTLIDPRPLLENGMGEATTRGTLASPGGEQALLIGETGRLIAFVVDRIGDIVKVSGTVAPLREEEAAERGISAGYVEGTYPFDNDGHESAIALNLAALYEDVIGKLEVWSRDA